MADSSSFSADVITTQTDSTGATVISAVQSNVTESTTVTANVTTGGVGPQGEAGPQGEQGIQGEPGVGVPVGGTTGQILAKATDTDYDTEWTTPAAAGGAGDVAGPASSTDNAVVRFDGTTGKVVQDSPEVTVGDTGILHLGPAEADEPMPSARFRFSDNDGLLSDAVMTAYGGGLAVLAMAGAGGTAASPADTGAGDTIGLIRFLGRTAGAWATKAQIAAYEDGLVNISTTGSSQLKVNNVPVATTTGTQTLTDKTLTSPTITTPTIRSTTSADIATFNNSLNSRTTSINQWGDITIDNSAALITRKAQFGGSTSGSTNLQASATASGTLTLPAATDTLVGRATTDTLTNKTISGGTVSPSAFITPSHATFNPTFEGDMVWDTDDDVLKIGTGSATKTLVTTNNTQTLTNKTLTTPKVDSLKDSNGNTALTLTPTASAVNGVEIVNGATGFAPSIKATGTDTNITLYMSGKGTGSLVMADSSGKQILEGIGTTSAVNYMTVQNAATGSKPTLTATGSDTNVSLNLVTKGSGTVQANGVSVATTTGTQTLTNKSISGSSNTFTNIPSSALVSTAAQAYKSGANQSIANATFTAISFDAEAYDSGSIHDNATNNTRMTAPVAGKYTVSTTIAFAPSTAGDRLLIFRVNGGANDRYGYQAVRGLATAGLSQVVTTATQLNLAAGDYVEVYAYQNTGGALDVAAETTQPGVCRFSMTYLGA